MTPRSFFMVLMKVVGLYLLFSLLLFIPSLISLFSYTGLDADSNVTVNILRSFVVILFMILLFYLILRFFVLKPEKLIDSLKLDQGFKEEKFELNIHRSTVLSIAVIVIGAILIIDSLPQLCREIYGYTQLKMTTWENPMIKFIIFYSVKLLIGILLFTNSRFVVNYIERQRKK